LFFAAHMPLAGMRPKPVWKLPLKLPLPSVRILITSFGQKYSSGNIPCVVNHGSIENKLQWKQPPQAQDYDPLLILVAEGLDETDFPFNFIARNAFKELLEAELGGDKAELVLPRLIAPLRL
jgi:hypothetical protein